MINLKNNLSVNRVLLTAIVCLIGFNSDILAQVISSTDSTPASNAGTPSTLVNINGYKVRAVEDNTARKNVWTAGMRIEDKITNGSASSSPSTCNVVEGPKYNEPCYVNTNDGTCSATPGDNKIIDTENICDLANCNNQLKETCIVDITISGIPNEKVNINCEGCVATATNGRRNTALLLKEIIPRTGGNFDSRDFGEVPLNAQVSINIENGEEYSCDIQVANISCGQNELKTNCSSTRYVPACSSSSYRRIDQDGHPICLAKPVYVKLPTQNTNNTTNAVTSTNNGNGGGNGSGSGSGNNNSSNVIHIPILIFPNPTPINTPHEPIPGT